MVLVPSMRINWSQADRQEDRASKRADMRLALSHFTNGSLEQTEELITVPSRPGNSCTVLAWSVHVSVSHTHFLLSQCRQRQLMTLPSSCPDLNRQLAPFLRAVFFSSLSFPFYYCRSSFCSYTQELGLFTCSEQQLSVLWLWFNWGSCFFFFFFLFLYRAAVRLGEDRGPAIWHLLRGVSDTQNAANTLHLLNEYLHNDDTFLARFHSGSLVRHAYCFRSKSDLLSLHEVNCRGVIQLYETLIWDQRLWGLYRCDNHVGWTKPCGDEQISHPGCFFFFFF